ncbi:GntR family transcriptional regulator [Lactobacillus sp. ESL0684]|uniref:GntR family transcriptional regulator n=1 Tax=unclassified Lactobacillus TaxID=2620435 RepID=UPI0023F72989|nr:MULTISPECIES: GntR family transcriptional regulator [unclassified Lactobacillus]WEV39676.1 GntR family transcriptional regulator [Lactobacillus sp. ESL0681]WEV43793.1 GntR family transcriptional regulator [Lactobacillus sp. ESL0684]
MTNKIFSPKEKVYNYLAQQLTLGKINRHEHITEQSLADQLGMSRTPIREALLELSMDNILERIPNKGFRIKFYTKKDLRELYSLIGLLDGKIAESTIDQLTDQDYSLMQFYVDSMNSALANRLYTKYNELQEQFHDIYLDKCANKLLRQELRSKKKSFIGKDYAKLSDTEITNLLKQTILEHQHILNLFKQHNTADLRKYIEEVHWNPNNSRYDVS